MSTLGRRRRISASRSSVAALALAWGLTGASAALAQQPSEDADQAPPPPASDSQPPEGDEFDSGAEIVVTAQKREQNVNSVPMSITAATGEQLDLAGITDVSDLPRIAPGLNYSVSTTGSPVYTLRGVGYNDAALSTRPAVTVYLDEAPIPFAVETRGTTLDVERVEVLKGPQGTLFGNNSTGGAINYIAAGPTSEFETGLNFTYGRFDQMYVDGYVSGPITDTLGARLAVEHRGMDDWQRSYTRDDSLGREDFWNVRAIFEWEPTSDLRARLTVNRWTDHSDSPAAQVIEIREQSPGFLEPTGLVGYPLAPPNNRAADWDPGVDLSRDNQFFQVTGRVDYDVSPDITLTSLTNYIDYEHFVNTDTDGTAVHDIRVLSEGTSTSFSQETRLTASLGAVNALLGVNYSRDSVDENQHPSILNSSLAYFLAAVTGLDRPTAFDNQKSERIRSYAAFGNVEYEITPELTLQAGARYSDTRNRYRACTADDGDGRTGAVFGVLFGTAIGPGECITLNVNTGQPGLVETDLNEDSISWRAGIQFEPTDRTLLYANVSRGYKAGGFPSLVATISPGLDAATQESVIAYEAGFRQGLFDRDLQLNGAVFYYDYRDKQVTGTINDPVLGPIAKLVNVPTSSIVGAELTLNATPADGLTLNLAASYIHSRVRGDFIATDSVGNPNVNFRGTSLPFAPEWQLSANARYEWGLSSSVDGFVGADFSYQSESFSDLGEVPETRVRGYALVGVQAGVESPDGRWRAYAWGRNIFDTYYWYNTVRLVDTISRFAGRPAAYGVTLQFNYP